MHAFVVSQFFQLISDHSLTAFLPRPFQRNKLNNDCGDWSNELRLPAHNFSAYRRSVCYFCAVFGSSLLEKILEKIN
jgi:hypothetical protein